MQNNSNSKNFNFNILYSEMKNDNALKGGNPGVSAHSERDGASPKLHKKIITSDNITMQNNSNIKNFNYNILYSDMDQKNNNEKIHKQKISSDNITMSKNSNIKNFNSYILYSEMNNNNVPKKFSRISIIEKPRRANNRRAAPVEPINRRDNNMFHSGKYTGLSYDEIINNRPDILNELSDNNHIAYRRFNNYYKNIQNDKKNHQKKLMNVFSEFNAIKQTIKAKDALIKSINKTTKFNKGNILKGLKTVQKQPNNVIESNDGYDIRMVNKSENKYFSRRAYRYAIDINNEEDGRNINFIENVLNDIVKDAAKYVKNEGDKIRLQLQNSELYTDRTSRPVTLADINYGVSDVIGVINNTIQSGVNYSGSGTYIEVSIWPGFSGKGRGKAFNANELKKKRGKITINNNDDLCMVRAIAVGNAIIDNHKDVKLIKDKRKKNQLKEANIIIDNTPINKTGPYDLCDIKPIAEYIKKNIAVVDLHNLNQIVYKTNLPYKPTIYLLYSNDHYDVITSMTAYLGYGYYCHDCNKGYNTKDIHQCQSIATDNEKIDISKKLNKRNDNVNKNNEIRNTGKYNKKTHVRECVNCKAEIIGNVNNHVCFMQKVELKQPSTKYIISDFETYTDANMVHKVNCAHSAYYTEEDDIITIQHDNIKDYYNWLVKKGHKGYTVIFHNGGGYDYNFIMQEMIINGHLPEVIFNGNNVKMMVLKSLNMHFIDSYLIFGTALKKLPEMFGFSNVVVKGDFPHKFNRPENYDYIGPMPNIEYYGVNQMKGNDRTKFINWYNEQVNNNYVFNFRDELNKYCADDVRVLVKAVASFRKICMDLENIDPFQYSTTASIAQSVYLANHMPKDMITVNKKYVEDEANYSIKSLKWITYLENLNNVKIQSAFNGLEAEITLFENDKLCEKIKVDGYDSKNNTVYQFQGCYFHGCQKCYKADDYNKDRNIKMIDLYNKTIATNNKIINSKYTLVELWEHDWDHMTNEAMNKKPLKLADLDKLFYDNIFQSKNKIDYEINKYDLLKNHLLEHDDEYYRHINPRAAFSGGRTNAVKLYYKCKNNEQIRYIDITSLYPWVNYTCRYPIGEPTIIKNDFDYSLKSYFGLVKCHVVPPNNLYHPVLWHHDHDNNDKLIFDLKPKIGTWTTVELMKAIEKGYIIDKIYEVWHFENSSTDLFKSYIQKFLKIKTEASGYPKWCITDDDKNTYIDVFEQHHGFRLDKDNIIKNPGLKNVAKLFLNSLWGKFAQRDNMGKTEFVTDPARFHALINSDDIDLTTFRDIEINEKLLQVHYKMKNEYIENNYKTNIFIAAFTTAHARIRLYDALDQLGKQVLYYDTDSIIYKYDHSTNDKEIITFDNRLGYFKDEIADEYGNNVYINEFVAGAPKNYAYTLSNNKAVSKVKGLSLNYENSQIINFNSIKKFILDSVFNQNQQPLLTNHMQFTKNQKNKSITTNNIIKKYNFNYDKCEIIIYEDEYDIIDTRPFGYVM